MTTVEVELPDVLAQSAQSEGLLSAQALQRMLEDTMRRSAGQRLLDVAQRIHAAGIAPMSEEEINAEVRAYRADENGRLQSWHCTYLAFCPCTSQHV